MKSDKIVIAIICLVINDFNSCDKVKWATSLIGGFLGMPGFSRHNETIAIFFFWGQSAKKWLWACKVIASLDLYLLSWGHQFCYQNTLASNWNFEDECKVWLFKKGIWIASQIFILWLARYGRSSICSKWLYYSK